MKCTIGKDGYKIAHLRLNSISSGKKVNKLVAQAFIPNPINKRCIDHINNNRQNNNIHNLRWATNQENQMNQQSSLSKASSTGVKGVSYQKRNKKWKAHIGYSNSKIYIGYFDNLQEAKETRKKKANELFGEFTNKIEKIKTELEELQELEKNLKIC